MKRATSKRLEEEPERTIARKKENWAKGGGLQGVVHPAKSDGQEAQATLGLGQ